MENKPEMRDVTKESDVFLSETELSQRWHVSTRMLQQTRWKGTGCAYVKIGRIVRYRMSDIRTYEASRTIQKGAQNG